MGDLSALEALVAEGERVDCHDEYGDTALHLAAMNGHIEAVYTLVTEYQVDVDIRNWELWTPLMWAVCRGHIEVAAYLVDKGASVAAQSVMGCTPMHLAAAMGHSHIVDWLLHEGADALIPDKFGMTPCSWACGSEAKATLQHIEELSRDVVKPRPMLEKSRFRSSLPDSAAAAAAAAAAKAALVRAEAAIAPAASDVAQPPGTVFSASALKTRSTHQQMNSNPVMRLRHLSVGPEAASSLQQATQHVLDSNEAEPDPAASPVAQQPHSLAASRLASPTAAMHDNDSADGQPGTRDTLAQPFQARSSHGSGGRSVAEAEPESHGEKSASLPQRPKLFGVETLSSEGGAVGSIKDATHRGVSEQELPAGVSASAALTKDRLVPVQQRHRSLADSTTGDIEAQQAESGLVLELEKAQDSATMAPNAVDSLDAPQLADDSDSSTSVSSTDSESVIQDFLRKLEGDGFPCPQPDAEAGLGPGLLRAESSGCLDDDSSSLESTADAAES